MPAEQIETAPLDPNDLLTEAWFESVQAMNAVKACYQVRLPALEQNAAFRWSAVTLPARFKPWSVDPALTHLRHWSLVAWRHRTGKRSQEALAPL